MLAVFCHFLLLLVLLLLLFILYPLDILLWERLIYGRVFWVWLQAGTIKTRIRYVPGVLAFPKTKTVKCFDSVSGTMKAWLMAHLSTGRTQPVLICADAVPTEAADLIATGAREEVDIIDLQRFHAQGALHGVVLHLRAVGHPTVLRGCRLKLSGTRRWENNTKRV